MSFISLKKEEPDAKIKKLYIEPTSRCNLSCKMCFRNSWIDEALGDINDETFCNILNYLKSNYCETVFFGGMGEPLFHRDICSMIKKVSEFAENTELITNAGLKTLWISMDGFSEKSYEKIRLGGRFRVITENIKGFNKARKNKNVKLGITFVVMEDNEEELNYINSFCDEFFVDIINISHAIPGKADNGAREFYEKGIPVGKMSSLGNDFTEKPKDTCPFIEDGACFIKWNGDVVPCMQLLHSSETYMFDIKRTVYSHSFGNIKETPLIDIYKSKEYKDFRNNVLSFDFPACTVCDGCEMRESNVEDCMFNEKPTCGACLWATGKVFCP